MSGSAPAGAPGLGSSHGSWRRSAFLRTPIALRVFLTTTVLGALVLPFSLRSLGRVETMHPPALTLAVLLAISVLNVEIGRLVEGGVSQNHRAHKALSALALCSVLLLPLPYVLPVVAVSYAHARWRGMRVPLWKWVGSASYVVLAGVGAGIAARAVHDDPDLMRGAAGWGLLAVLVAAALFLAVETVLFHGSAYLNSADDEVWLRRTLAGSSFYVTEASVLLMGGLSAAVWTGGAWFLVLLVPVYALAQRAAMNEPLRERAETDEKTGLLRFESWRSLAVAEQKRCRAKGRPWSVAFADLDHFKAYNDTWGHLAGDGALSAVADVFRAQLRSRDVVARFGGEEFCVFLPDTGAAEGARIAERLRAAVAERTLPEPQSRLTISIGVATFPPGVAEPEFVTALTAADRALFEAKLAGRDRVCVRVKQPEPHGRTADEPVASPAQESVAGRPAD